MLSLREYREPTARLPDHLPWAALIAPGVVLCKGCTLQKTIQFRGPDLDAAEPVELVSATARLNDALKRLGGGWSIFVEAQRFESSVYPESQWTVPAAEVIDFERRAHFRAAGAHFESAYYLTFVWQLPSDQQHKLLELFYDDPDEDDATEDRGLQRDLSYFQRTVAETLDILRAVLPQAVELSDDETLEYLHSTISTDRHPVRTPECPHYLDALLPDQAFTPGDVPMLGEHFLPVATVTGFPPKTYPGIFDKLNHLRVEYRWVSRFICMDRDEAKKMLESRRRQWFAKRKSLFTLLKEEATKEPSALLDSAAANHARDVDLALQDLGYDHVAFGYLTTTLVVWDRDYREALRKQLLLKKAIQDAGFIVKDEKLNSTQAWLGSLPGHVYANVRKPVVHTLNLAHLMPLSAVWSGDTANEHLARRTGVARAQIYCSSGSSPFRFNQNLGDLGHMMVLGPSGAGKSTLLALLEMQWLRYPGARVVIFDKKRSARGATLAAGGVMYEPGADRNEAGLSFHPLARIDESAERIWASRFVLMLLELQGVATTPAVQAAVDESLLTVAAASSPALRTLTDLCRVLGSHGSELAAALRPYTLRGNFGQIFDAQEDNFHTTHWTMIEMGHLMELGDRVVVPALEYLFHRIEDRFDGTPTLLVLDEAWLFLRHPVFAARIQTWFKTLRSKSVYVVFASQEVQDLVRDPDLYSSISSASGVQVFLPDEKALSTDQAAGYRRLGLYDAEIELLARSRRKRDYYYRSPKGRRLFSLDLGPAQLALIGMSQESDHPVLDRIVAERRPDEYALAMLEHNGVRWAVDLLRDLTGAVGKGMAA